MSVIRKLNVSDCVTLANAACGFFCIALAFSGRYFLSMMCLVVAVGFDALDGTLARKMGNSSQFGFHLDGFADLLSFGIAPACFLLSLRLNALSVLSGLILILAGILRLSSFKTLPYNGEYVGMPITINGVIFPAGYLLYRYAFQGKIFEEYTFPALAIVCAALMLSSIRIKKPF